MRLLNTSLYWKVCLINGAVLAAATAVLLLSPARVSRQVVVSEAVVLTVGLGLVLVVTAVLLHRALAPVDRVIREMATVRLGGEGRRLDVVGEGPGAQLVRSYHAMLERLEAERRSSSAQALAAQEAERHRIARELHDQVGQSLTVVLLGLKQLQDRAPADLGEELALVRESARTGLDDVRRVARELRPGVLDDLGLQAALASLATDVTASGGPAVRRTFGPGLPALDRDIEVVVYRVAQEALTNVVRHAGPGGSTSRCSAWASTSCWRWSTTGVASRPARATAPACWECAIGPPWPAAAWRCDPVAAGRRCGCGCPHDPGPARRRPCARTAWGALDPRAAARHRGRGRGGRRRGGAVAAA